MDTKDAGKRGGQANTESQQIARLENLKRARKKRWPAKRHTPVTPDNMTVNKLSQ